MLNQIFVLTSLVVYSKGMMPSKINKITPSITNSFVNLGKVDISFHIHKNEAAKPVSQERSLPRNFMRPGEPCPCMQSSRSPLSFKNPTTFLKKLFAGIEGPSFACCDSHELVHEDTIIMDFEPIQSRPLQTIFPMKPNMKALESLLHSDMLYSKPVPLPKMAPKAKSIEFFFVPPHGNLKNLQEMKEVGYLDRVQPQKEVLDKKDITAVGDQHPKSFMYIPHVNAKSVKKDLRAQDRDETTGTSSTSEIPIEITTPAPAAVVNVV